MIEKGIDLARTTLGKSLMSGTGSWGCERDRFYSETIRTPDGRRLPLVSDEKMLFGTAIDRAHSQLMFARREGAATLEELPVSRAIQAGTSQARAEPHADEIDWTTFDLQVETAILKLVGVIPNANPNRDASGPAPIWWIPTYGLKIQGDDGESIVIQDGFAPGRSLAITPDYGFLARGAWTGWVDVKTTGKAFSYPQKWAGAEAVIYDLGMALANGGELPRTHAYMEYRRNIKPYWELTQAEVLPDSVALARAFIRRWQLALDGGTVDALGFEVGACQGCRWREMIPEIHAGCPIGQSVVAITTPTEGDPA